MYFRYVDDCSFLLDRRDPMSVSAVKSAYDTAVAPLKVVWSKVNPASTSLLDVKFVSRPLLGLQPKPVLFKYPVWSGGDAPLSDRICHVALRLRRMAEVRLGVDDLDVKLRSNSLSMVVKHGVDAAVILSATDSLGKNVVDSARLLVTKPRIASASRKVVKIRWSPWMLTGEGRKIFRSWLKVRYPISDFEVRWSRVSLWRLDHFCTSFLSRAPRLMIPSGLG
jgi:hypothetical protein